METDKRLTTLEEELKLIKGELKQSLASVRDYLLNMELPASEFANVLAALGDTDGEKVIMKGYLTSESPQKYKAEPAPRAPQKESLELESGLPSEEEGVINPEEPLEDESEMPPEDELDNQDENLESEAELPLEEEQMEHEKINAEATQSTPKVNLLANLINWVARAKKEIGYEQLPIFLEVYGISGHLSPELKEVILHLSDITSEQAEDANSAAIWSQAMLSLHGILTGGDAPLYPVKPSWDDGGSEIQPSEDKLIESKVDKPKDRPVKLKLVFPNGDGKGKEFCIDLTPEADNNGS